MKCDKKNGDEGGFLFVVSIIEKEDNKNKHRSLVIHTTREYYDVLRADVDLESLRKTSNL